MQLAHCCVCIYIYIYMFCSVHNYIYNICILPIKWLPLFHCSRSGIWPWRLLLLSSKCVRPVQCPIVCGTSPSSAWPKRGFLGERGQLKEGLHDDGVAPEKGQAIP